MTASPSYAVDFAGVAQRDLQSIVEFIAADDATAARRVLNLMEARVAALKRMPERGRVVPELAAMGVHLYRELVVAPWRIIYRISGRTVYILAVLDGRRNLEDVLLDRLVR